MVRSEIECFIKLRKPRKLCKLHAKPLCASAINGEWSVINEQHHDTALELLVTSLSRVCHVSLYFTNTSRIVLGHVLFINHLSNSHTMISIYSGGASCL